MRDPRLARVFIAGATDHPFALVLGTFLASKDVDLTICTTHDAARLSKLIGAHADAVILLVGSADSDAETGSLVSQHPDVAFLFVVPARPAPHALARLARSVGAAIVPVDDGVPVAAATLTSLLAQRAIGQQATAF